MAEARGATLRFAATHALSFSFLPGWLRGIEQHNVLGPVTLASDVFSRCEALLLQGQVQFVLAHAHPLSPGALQAHGCPSVGIGADTLVAVSAPDPRGAPRHALLQATAAAPLQALEYSLESGVGRILRDVHGAALAAYPARSLVQAHLASVLRTMALDGRGLAWLPMSLAATDLAAGRLAEAAPATWHIAMEIRLYRAAASMGRAAEDFWSQVAADVAAAGRLRPCAALPAPGPGPSAPASRTSAPCRSPSSAAR